jgi:hypothetical protein
MHKRDAVALFGTRQLDLAHALELGPAAISNWPDELPQPLVDRVIGAAVRLGKPIPGLTVVLVAQPALVATTTEDQRPPDEAA